MSALTVGARVRIPWGLQDSVVGEVVEVWGDPAAHIRVALQLDADDERVIVLLTQSTVEAA